jgi:hypothetical protein
MSRVKNSTKIAAAWIAVFALLALFTAEAQFWGGGRYRQRFESQNPERIKEQEAMKKAINPEFEEDVFTFARLRFQADTDYRLGGGRVWEDDAPEADYNLIFRLHEVTSLKVRPGLNFVDITTADLENHPFVYLAAAGRADFSDEEVAALRRYLLNGGFIMADDFWGDEQWEHFHAQMKRIFPEREPEELSLDHRIFHTVFDFKKEPQIPSVGTYMRTGQSFDPGWPYNQKDQGPHYYALYDDKKRMMALLCHNNHYGDGWEHEGDDETYFDKFSEPMAYPMLINILVYTMSH